MSRLLLTAALLAASAGWAHGTPPQALLVRERPGDPNELLVGTTFGALVSFDGACSWHLVCEEAIGYAKNRTPAWWLSPSGATFAATFDGVFVSRDHACTWAPVPPFADAGATDLQGLGGTVVAVSGTYGIVNQIYRSTDDGRSFTAVPATGNDAGFYSTVRFAPSDPQRVYVGEWWFDPYSSWVLKSVDGAQTFTTFDHSADLPTAGAFYVLAVHPANPDLLLAEVTSPQTPPTSYLLLSENGGQSFAAVATAVGSPFNSAAFSADGQKAWAAAGDQLFGSTDSAHTFSVLPLPTRSTCVDVEGDRLYACSKQEVDGWEVGRGSTASGAFSPGLIWQQIDGPLGCGANSPLQQACDPVWPVIQLGFAGPPPGFDAGTLCDGGIGGAGGGGGSGGHKGCGCASGTPLALFGLIFLIRGMSSRATSG